MDAEEMAHANWRLDNPPVVDVAVSRRMGLFVVARLAARHGIRVRLRPASRGGLTALVWLPDEVIMRESLSATFRRFQPPAAGPLVPDTPAGLSGDGADDRSAAAQAVAAARVARFGPAQPDAGDADTDPGTGLDGSELAAAPTAEAIAPVPPADGGQVYGTDGAAAPANGMPHGNGELPGNGAPPSNGVPRGNGAAPGNGDAPGVIVPPAASIGEENRLPIFESVESDWFRRGRLGSDWSAPVASQVPSSAGWSSPADEGWQAAEVAQAPVSSGTTRAGLPRRVPKANLVPGGVDASAAAPMAPRSAAQTRERLASFQQGIRNARAVTPSDEDYQGAEDGREED
jgi:hypothetical protein